MYYRIAGLQILLLGAATGIGLAEEPELAFDRIPDTVTVNLGKLPIGETTTKIVRIHNRTGFPFSPHETRSDCGCAIGIVPDKEVKPGESLKVRLRVRPGHLGKFKRALLVSSEKGSDQKLRLNLNASVLPRFELRPTEIRIDPQSEKASSRDGYSWFRYEVRIA